MVWEVALKPAVAFAAGPGSEGIFLRHGWQHGASRRAPGLLKFADLPAARNPRHQWRNGGSLEGTSCKMLSDSHGLLGPVCSLRARVAQSERRRMPLVPRKP